jgi:hypothetical protein
MATRIYWAGGLSLAILGMATGCSPAGNAIEQDLPPSPSASSNEKPAGPPAGQLPPGHPLSVAAGPQSKPGESPVAPADEAASHTIVLGDKLTLTAPASWVPKQPGNPMILQEFTVPAAKGDPRDGRMTVSSAGGTVAANIDRWAGQFQQPDGAKSDGKMNVQKKTVAGQEVNLVDISGTYQESVGMMQPPVPRPGYRMLAAILPGDGPSYFIKFYGPKKTVGEHEKEFRAMLDGMRGK